MSRGISNVFRLAASQAVSSSVALVTATGMTIPIAANQELHARIKVYFSVGASGGCRFQVTVPAGVVSFNNAITLQNTVAPATVTAVQIASAAFTNALANAGNHFLEMEVHVVNGVNAGSVSLQFAQNTSDATPINLFRGSWMETTGGPF